MNKKESFKLLDNAYFKIKDILESIRWGYHNEYYQLHNAEEKAHRRFCPEHIKPGLTQAEAVKLFYVLNIVQAIFVPSIICNIKSYLHLRKSIFMAYSLVANYHKELSEALKDIPWQDILKIDYAELMK
jgi:L-ribulose-5-phosphate 3-epimerase UlaE